MSDLPVSHEKVSPETHRSTLASTAAIINNVEKQAVAPSGIPVNDASPPVQLSTSLSKSSKDDASSTKDEPDPFAHLPQHEADVLRRQLDVPIAKVNYFSLYRYATRNDLLIISLSCITAIVGGALMPLMTVVFGALTGKFQNFFQGGGNANDFKAELAQFSTYFVYLGIGMFVMTFIANVGFMYTGEHITGKIRQEFLAAILRQNIGYFDKLGAGEITTRITSDTNLIQEGISEKVPLTLTAIATFVSAFVVAYVRYWKLALILSSTIVAIVVTIGIGSQFILKWNKVSLEHTAKGGSVAEEVLSSIRNATAFNAQDKLARQYNTHLIKAEHAGFNQKAVLGGLVGILFALVYLSYGLSFWMGSRFLVDGSIDLPQLITIQLVIIIGAFSLGNVGPAAASMGTAIAAASKIYGTIDRVSPLDPDSDAGGKLEHVDGVVELKNIRHIYPSRPEVVVMEDVSLYVPAGKSTALVGASGSGKSTIIGLVERFYEPVHGQVFLDGHDISTLNLRWLRHQVALVSQEPTLFATTIFQNIAHGLIGTEHECASTEKLTELVEAAAKMANAHDFICSLPEKYETHVGERGFLLSGGQKQRVAIARAVVGDPKILLLDEATSALDTKSEGVVQTALDKAAEGRTTIVIAHRLSTIKNVDNIVVMSQGAIVEQGTHQELLLKKGSYFNLVTAQEIAGVQDPTDREDREEVEAQPGLMRQLTSVSTGRPESVKLTRTTSVSEQILKNKESKTSAKYSTWTLIKLIASFNRHEWYYMLLGLVGCVFTGAADPCAAVFFAKSITALTLPADQYGELRSQANFWSLMYLMLAVVVFLAFVTHGISFAYCSERLIHRARDSAFRHMLRQDMAFFDQDSNNSGALSSFLATETTHLAGISGVTLGSIMTTLTTLIVASIIALAVGWKLALVCIACIPVLLACGFLRFWLLARFVTAKKAAYEKSAAYACEASSAIRTVASLTREKDVWRQYEQKIETQRRAGLRSILQSSSLYAAAQALVFGCIALGFWYGGTLIGNGEYSMFQFFLVFTAVIFGAQSAGTAFAFAPDMSKSRGAASELKTLYDRKPEIDSWNKQGATIEQLEGTIEFRDVHFRYPTRPDTAVLRGINLSVKPGQYIALVGPSGCGKSTSIALLERFYDAQSGNIFVDGQDISTMNVVDYRSRIALVSQEPTLYQGSIRENILLGAQDETKITDSQIEKACKDANIYDFITSMPNGFNTIVGSKGALLSGGQKQRIAIARALLSDPRVLLLDEATSALDSESEKVVQEALDRAAKGRTTIAVAHRLSTIQRADCIYVFDSGRIAELGTHGELMRKKGRYCELVNLQNLG